jgi:GNAT superfamily N-acetyltransferase
MKTDIQLIEVSGEEILPYIPELARLRMTVFRDFPYLYDGDFDYEAEYLKTYSNCRESFMALVIEAGQIVGASSGLPLIAEDEEMYELFISNGYRVEEFFYFGESVLLHEHRGLGFGKRFFDSRERYARSKGYSYTTFCAVQRSENHPLRPSRYKPLDLFWQRLGYEQLPEIQTTFSWKDIDKTDQDSKVMQFWMKKL